VDADRGAVPRASSRTARRRASPRGRWRGEPSSSRGPRPRRSASRSSRGGRRARHRGAAIVIGPPPSWEPLDAALGALSGFSWLVFTSVNGVTMVDRRLTALGIAWSALAGRRVAAIGPAHGRRAPRARRARGRGARGVPRGGSVERLRGCSRGAIACCWPRAAQTRDVLVTSLRALGVEVVEVPAYATRRAEANAARLGQALSEGAVDAVTFTSSSTARTSPRCSARPSGEPGAAASPSPPSGRSRRPPPPSTAWPPTSCRRSIRFPPRAGDRRVVRRDSEAPRSRGRRSE